jgi:hypothetical protein
MAAEFLAAFGGDCQWQRLEIFSMLCPYRASIQAG